MPTIRASPEGPPIGRLRMAVCPCPVEGPGGCCHRGRSPLRTTDGIGYTDVGSSGKGARDEKAAYEGTLHPRHFTDDFKRQTVDPYNAGKPKREIEDEYYLGKSTVERWIKSINATGSPNAADNRTPEQNRILELKSKDRRLRMEVDVL